MTLRSRHGARKRRWPRRSLHDVRFEPVGGWAGPIPPEAPVGKWAGPARLRRQAPGGWSGDPDRQRQGSFADAEYGGPHGRPPVGG